MSWTALKAAEADDIAYYLCIPARRGELCEAFIHRPAFYTCGVLLNVRSGGLSSFYLVTGEGGWGTRTYFELEDVQVIHAGNREAGLCLGTLSQADAYLRFFCSVLETEAGFKFNILDALPDGVSVAYDRPYAFQPLRILDGEGDTGFTATACVEYAGDLFEATFRIEPDGRVEMTDEDWIGRLTGTEKRLQGVRSDEGSPGWPGGAGPGSQAVQ